MIRAVADTHAIIWYLFADGRLSNLARSYIEQATIGGDFIAISSITFAEIVYLAERNRIPMETLPELIKLLDSGQSVWVEVPFDRAIANTMCQVDRAQVPELADRIIAATALHLNVPVITRDHKIQASNLQTIW
ncbi:type II toxin-antitoxin system VapC family toxin [Leptolyngbya sp. AN03gr2]|uniref:type II toxin-antitoxin system VapC family toxin n=1 Tax=unclassified Leptolyngbya TaxID=2650499 RepID=UPI003D316B73